MTKQWEKQKIAVIIVLVIVVAGFSVWESKPTPLAQGTAPKELLMQESEPKGVLVHVSGAVRNPGLHYLKPGSRAEEAVAKAGGFLPEADQEKVNLAKKCKDGMQIRVPRLKVSKTRKEVKRKVQSATVVTTIAAPKKQAALKVNLNTADKKTLESLPGIGAVTAQKIIKYRNSRPFTSIEEVMKIPGIGKAKFKRIRNRLEV